MRLRDVLYVYSSGLCELVLSALGGAVVVLMVLHMVGAAFGTSVDADTVLLYTWQVIIFFALWPGQTFWTIRRITSDGRVHSIVGIPSDDDMRVDNHRRAQRMRVLRD